MFARWTSASMAAGPSCPAAGPAGSPADRPDPASATENGSTSIDEYRQKRFDMAPVLSCSAGLARRPG